MEGIYQKLRNLDAYPKINEDFYSRTLSGGLITLISSTLMLFLFFSEFSTYPLLFFSFFLYLLIILSWSFFLFIFIFYFERLVSTRGY